MIRAGDPRRRANKPAHSLMRESTHFARRFKRLKSEPGQEPVNPVFKPMRKIREDEGFRFKVAVSRR